MSALEHTGFKEAYDHLQQLKLPAKEMVFDYQGVKHTCLTAAATSDDIQLVKKVMACQGLNPGFCSQALASLVTAIKQSNDGIVEVLLDAYPDVVNEKYMVGVSFSTPLIVAVLASAQLLGKEGLKMVNAGKILILVLGHPQLNPVCSDQGVSAVRKFMHLHVGADPEQMTMAKKSFFKSMVQGLFDAYDRVCLGFLRPQKLTFVDDQHVAVRNHMIGFATLMLTYACMYDTVDVAAVAIERGADFDATADLGLASQDGVSRQVNALMIAVHYGHAAVVELLLAMAIPCHYSCYSKMLRQLPELASQVDSEAEEVKLVSPVLDVRQSDGCGNTAIAYAKDPAMQALFYAHHRVAAEPSELADLRHSCTPCSQ